MPKGFKRRLKLLTMDTYTGGLERRGRFASIGGAISIPESTNDQPSIQPSDSRTPTRGRRRGCDQFVGDE